MNIGNAVAELRKDSGLSQETLAGRIGVSRQAVTKWECGEAAPDLDNLVALAGFFGVTVDSLLRSPSCGGNSGETGDSLSLANKAGPGLSLLRTQEFTAFLCGAKRETYAGKGAETASTRKASHDLSYSEGDFAYYDTYLGGELFAGEEAVWHRGVPVWAMNYSGRVLMSDLFPSDFLKECLYAATPALPYRGPRVFERGEYAYHCFVNGDIQWFQGTEEILVRGEKTYECVFHGGGIS